MNEPGGPHLNDDGRADAGPTDRTVLNCAVLSGDLVTRYAAGALAPVAAWSVEAHLPSCPACRATLDRGVSAERLARNRAVLLTRAALPRDGSPGLAERMAARVALPPWLWRLLAVTPSLRGPWLAGMTLVLGATIGAAWLFGVEAGHLADTGSRLADGRALALVPFLLLAPLLPLAGVAVAFDRRFDPARDVLAAAPAAGLRLFLARSVAVIVAALIPTMTLSLALPVSPLLALLVALPALAVSVTGLALSTVLSPLRAGACAAVGWVTAVAACALFMAAPQAVLGPGAQVASAAVTCGGAWLLCARRHRLAVT